MCTYLPTFVYPCKPTSKFLSGSYAQNRGPKFPLISSCTVGFFSRLKTKCGDLSQSSSLAFIVDFSGILQLKNSEFSLWGSQELWKIIIWKVGMTCTYANENEEQLCWKKFLQINTVDTRLRGYFCRVVMCLWTHFDHYNYLALEAAWILFLLIHGSNKLRMR